MKVIDLLNKIANGEEVPKKIRYEDIIYTYNEYDKDYFEIPISEDEYRGLFNMKDSILTQYLNDEIEIIEDTPKEEIQVLSRWYPPKEDKKIKRIQSCGDNLYSEYIGQWLVNTENYSEYDELLMNKINEIIDKVNGEDNE